MLTNSIVVLTNSILVLTNSIVMLTNSIVVLTYSIVVLTNSIVVLTNSSQVRKEMRDKEGGASFADTPRWVAALDSPLCVCAHYVHAGRLSMGECRSSCSGGAREGRGGGGAGVLYILYITITWVVYEIPS